MKQKLDWDLFFTTRRSDDDISNILFETENNMLFISNKDLFFKNNIIKTITKNINKRFVDNKNDLELMFKWFIEKTDIIKIDEETFDLMNSILHHPNFDFFTVNFFKNIFKIISIENAFDLYNNSNFKNQTHLQGNANLDQKLTIRFQKTIIELLNTNPEKWVEIKENIEKIKDENKKSSIINLLFSVKNKEIQEECIDKYWNNFEESRKLTIVNDLLLRKNIVDIQFFEKEIKQIFKQKINELYYFDLVGKYLNKIKIKIFLKIFEEMKNEGFDENKINKLIYKIIDKCLLNKSQIIINFIEEKELNPKIIPSNFMILTIYRSIHTMKKEESDELIKRIFKLAKNIGEEKWLQDELYDFQKTQEAGIQFTLGKNERVKKKIIEHLYESFSRTLSNDNKINKKIKI